MPSITLLTTIAEFLKTYGAWGVVVIQGFVIWRLAVHIQRLQTQHHDTVRNLLLDHNKTQRGETERLVDAMVSTRQALTYMHDSVKALVNRGG